MRPPAHPQIMHISAFLLPMLLGKQRASWAPEEKHTQKASLHNVGRGDDYKKCRKWNVRRFFSLFAPLFCFLEHFPRSQDATESIALCFPD